MIKKIMAVLLFMSFCAPVCLLAQDQELVELAKKEKARRENLKGQKIRIITNQDLKNLTKTPAIIISAETADAQKTQPGQSSPPQSESSTTPAAGPETVGSSTLIQKEEVQPRPVDASQNSLEDAWKKASEYVELLTMKMNALWQQFYSLTDTQTKESVQREISDTYEKLLKAQEEETRLRQEYENQINKKKSAEAPTIWIR
ncbi:MAG: hypothetical protein PHU81_09105 [Acidobacteriota bacterium]|nr:hypothetical protein [Acidobacteriota bacterium]